VQQTIVERSLPTLIDLSIFRDIDEPPAIELPPELAVDPPPLVPNGRALMIPVII
jgi:hypothetical protein